LFIDRCFVRVNKLRQLPRPVPPLHSCARKKKLSQDAVSSDAQAEDEAMQTRALQALQSLAKGKRGGSNLPMQSIQTAFQQGKGLPRLVTLLDRVVTPRNSRSGQGKAIMAGAIDALAAMTRNNAAARCTAHCFIA